MIGSGRRLAIAAAVLMIVQAGLGRAFPGAYKDMDWVAATWIGNDWVTLLVAAPLLFTAVALSRANRLNACGLGILAYAIYNSTFYLFGARLNAFLPLYVLVIACATAALVIELLAGIPDQAPCPGRRERLIGAYLIAVGLVLASIWIGFWAAFAFAGRPTPIEPEAFRVVAATDLLLLVPTLLTGGWLLWRRHPAGLLIGTIAAVQGALYLLVLTVNSALLIEMGFSRLPGELPIWAPLFLFTAAAALILLGGVQPQRVHR